MFTCSHCGHSDRIERYIDYTYCRTCGNIVYNDYAEKARFPFVQSAEGEKEVNKIDKDKAALITELAEKGIGIRKIAEQTGAARETVRRHIKLYYASSGKDRPVNKGGYHDHESKEKMEVVDTIKGKHRACINHPDKYAVRKGLCQACYTQEKKKQEDERMKALEPNKPAKVTPVKTEAETPKKAPTLIVNFDGYSELYDKLVKLSHRLYRTPDQQILFLIEQSA